ADYYDESKPRRGARSVTGGKRLQSQFESRVGDSAFARKNRSLVATAIQPAVRDSADPDRVTGRNRPQENVAASIPQYIGAIIGNRCVTFFRPDTAARPNDSAWLCWKRLRNIHSLR